jgi:hypothetical protein
LLHVDPDCAMPVAVDYGQSSRGRMLLAFRLPAASLAISVSYVRALS